MSLPRGYKRQRNDWLLADMQPIISLYFEFETVLKFYNLGVWSYSHLLFDQSGGHPSQ